MPTEACQWYYECEGCGSLLRPLPGDCCVFCSYGTTPCPPIQKGNSCCQKIASKAKSQQTEPES
ncbi:GDCCVxC domain-containing (seleno)protein [Neptuniibacter halophilus]|uniref:GDCCVxC domain-containing (seleno)protein n=1 Tax=Neptuniibacter halophilus TaxID=651666 RepID=UPI003D9AFC50